MNILFPSTSVETGCKVGNSVLTVIPGSAFDEVGRGIVASGGSDTTPATSTSAWDGVDDAERQVVTSIWASSDDIPTSAITGGSSGTSTCSFPNVNFGK